MPPYQRLVIRRCPLGHPRAGGGLQPFREVIRDRLIARLDELVEVDLAQDLREVALGVLLSAVDRVVVVAALTGAVATDIDPYEPFVGAAGDELTGLSRHRIPRWELLSQ